MAADVETDATPGTGPGGRAGAGARPTTGSVEEAVALADGLVDAWGSWGPNMTPDARQVAFISDRSGTPQLWLQDVVLDGAQPPARHVPLSEDPVVSVRWAADSRWLACEVATDGGVRTAVWVVRPDGSDARRQLMRECETWVDLTGLAWAAAADRIRRARVHVLVDLNGLVSPWVVFSTG